jgi:hypothetical protein
MKKNGKRGQLSQEQIVRLTALGFCWDIDATVWDKMFAELVAYKKVHGHCNVPQQSGPLGYWCTNHRHRKDRLTPEQIARLEGIGFCWDLKTAVWEQRFAELIVYKEAHGHCNVPHLHGPLGYWCASQRQRKSRLSSEQIARLDAIGFCWNTIDAAWDKMFAQLVAYKEIHGHCNAPHDGSTLGNWCASQRRKKSQLSPEQIARLDAIGFCWNPRDATWEKMFAELAAFKKAHGHCDVPCDVGPLRRWCMEHRARKKKGLLSPEQIARLEAIGFCWNPHDAAWDKMFVELVAYKEVHGHCNVPHDGSSLATWCDRIRRSYKKDKLSPERIVQLEAIGFCRNPHDVAWEKMFATLVAFKKDNGHCNVPQANGSLGTWCSQQRLLKKQGKLSPERLARLAALGFCWKLKTGPPRKLEPAYKAAA